MSGRSLQLRLLTAGLAAMLVAVAAAAFALTLLFERHVERRALAEAGAHLRGMIASATLGGDGVFVIGAPPADPLFEQAYSGLYWQAQSGTQVLARSRSLWDVDLLLPEDELIGGAVHVHSLAGPRGAQLLAVERGLILTGPHGASAYRLVVAMDRREIVQARNAFLRDLVIALGVLGLALSAAFVAQVRIGLRPLSTVRDQVQRIRSGQLPRLGADFPREVTPLADEINTLLDERDAAIARARGRAADLAHGLKTPLTALNGDVRRLRQAGQGPIADQIEALGAMMQRHVQRELARARLAGRDGRVMADHRLRPVVEGIAAAVARTPDAAGKAFDFDFDPDLVIGMERADLEELLGNLIENAARHARSLIRIGASITDGRAVLMVEDDGPGIGACDMERLLKRGERIDLSGSGAGLGLSIVDEVASAYDGSITLAASPLGGLAVSIVLPRRHPCEAGRDPSR